MPQFEFTIGEVEAKGYIVMLELDKGKTTDTYYLKQLFANVDADEMQKLQDAKKMSDVTVQLIWTPTRSEAVDLPKDEAEHMVRDIPVQPNRKYHLVIK